MDYLNNYCSRESLLQSLGRELLLASSAGRILEVIALLIQGAPVNKQYEDGFTPLMCGARAGQIEIERLFEAGADHRLKAADGSLTALSIAVIRQHEDVAELLLRAGADPNIIESNGISLIWLAISRNQHRMLEILLDGGASLNGYNMARKMTNLGYAAQQNKPEAIIIHLNRGALPSARGYSRRWISTTDAGCTIWTPRDSALIDG